MTIRFVSYNILADSYINPEWYPAESKPWLEPVSRHPALAEAIMAMDADVLALQEVELDVFVRLKLMLMPMGYACRYEAKGRGKPDGCALFARRSSCTVTAWSRLDYNDGPSNGPVSGHLAQLATIVWQERQLTVANTHLKWAPDDTPREEHLGARQLDQLVALAETERSEGWLICGDLNCTPHSHVLAPMRAAGFRDSHARALAPTCNANQEPRKLDHIFINEALVASATPITSINADTPLPSASEPSDHLPVEVELDWR